MNKYKRHCGLVKATDLVARYWPDDGNLNEDTRGKGFENVEGTEGRIPLLRVELLLLKHEEETTNK